VPELQVMNGSGDVGNDLAAAVDAVPMAVAMMAAPITNARNTFAPEYLPRGIVAFRPPLDWVPTVSAVMPRVVCNFTSAWCASWLADRTAKGRTHSETSSNYLCTNDE
jgi:hypothetical protein